MSASLTPKRRYIFNQFWKVRKMLGYKGVIFWIQIIKLMSDCFISINIVGDICTYVVYILRTKHSLWFIPLLKLINKCKTECEWGRIKYLMTNLMLKMIEKKALIQFLLSTCHFFLCYWIYSSVIDFTLKLLGLVLEFS